MGYIKCIVVFLFVISTVYCENCVTYDFGKNFNNTFNHDNDICNGFASWDLGKYSESNVASPHPYSDLFISPGAVLSCVSSYTFEMRSTGVLEVNIYMESVSKEDQIVILANEIRSADNNAVTGSFMLTPLNVNYVDGWHVLKIDLFGTGVFDGYVTFLGIAAPGSTIIVDSFKYIPPMYEDSCYLYDENFVAPTAPPQLEAECVTYNFENNFNELFNDERGFCTSFSEWNLNEYVSISLDSPNSDSQNFISPQAQISCTSSFNFNVVAGGTIEVNVYMEARSSSDQIAIIVNQILDDNNDAVTGSFVLSPLLNDYVDGWQVLTIDLAGGSSYTAYISFIGMASEDSIVLIDSFRYIPPNVDEKTCCIYEVEKYETTTPIAITTPEPSGEECVSYNFESNFDDTFDMSNQLCNGYSAWNLGTYYSLSIDNIYPKSSTFIAPNITSSCVSSFVFEMKPGGIVEVNVYMKSLSDFDYIIVLAKKVMLNGVDTVAGFKLYYADNSDFVEGWNVLKVTVVDFRAFNGYITLIGSMAEDSIVLIDSFRYIPPNNEEPCNIY